MLGKGFALHPQPISLSALEALDSSVDHTNVSYVDLSSGPSLSLEHHAIQNHLHNPDWVLCPWNIFIIFCCEHSHKHAHDHSDPSHRSSCSNKTLLKHAREEWHHLSAWSASSTSSLPSRRRPHMPFLLSCPSYTSLFTFFHPLHHHWDTPPQAA